MSRPSSPRGEEACPAGAGAEGRPWRGSPRGAGPSRATCAGGRGISSSVGPSASASSQCRSWRAGSCVSGRRAPGPLATARAGWSCSRGSSAPPLTRASAAARRRQTLSAWTVEVALRRRWSRRCLRANSVAASHGGNARVQPGRSGALRLHEISAPWVRGRLKRSSPQIPGHEGEESFAHRIKIAAGYVDAEHDVAGPRGETPHSARDLVRETEGDRLRKRASRFFLRARWLSWFRCLQVPLLFPTVSLAVASFCRCSLSSMSPWEKQERRGVSPPKTCWNIPLN